MLQAEDRRAPNAHDLAVLRAGAHSADPDTARIGVRALGRLERPSLVPDISPLLRHSQAEVRAEAANAIGQAAQGWKRERPSSASVEAAFSALVTRLKVEADWDVRSAIAETIGRLPYPESSDVDRAEQALVEFEQRAESVSDRLGVAQGFEALIRINRKTHEPGEAALGILRRLATPGGGESASGTRVRRLSLEALVSANAVGDDLAVKAAHDTDAQVRRIAIRAVPFDALTAAVHDTSFLVRIEALRQMKARNASDMCVAAVEASRDADTIVALVAIDQLSSCGSTDEALVVLDRYVSELAGAEAPRAWHRPAHAIVALAGAQPDRARAALPGFLAARVWQLRLYAARAASALKDRESLEKLAADDNDNVREASVEALSALAGHDADAIYVAQLTRPGNQIVRAAAAALADSPNRESVVPALRAALARLVADNQDNSHDARTALARTLSGLGEKASDKIKGSSSDAASDLPADELRRLASPRARITIRDVGVFELALITSQAPATVLRFAHLAESGYYNGLTFHRVVPDFVIQGGSPGANEYIGEPRFMRDEVGLWPHVRGAVGISTRGRDTGDAQFFVDLVDNPRLDHEYTVFAQVLNGIDVVDRVLEGDVIERIEIVPGS
ncbi:MAG TPA: peptidylprolyl isomerase [Vicinamibacterales bacterium]